MAQVKISMTVVRIAVARLESMPETPTLASNAVAAANAAESNAQKTQVMLRGYADSKNQADVGAALERGLFKIDRVPLAAFNPRANLGRRQALFRLLVGVDTLFHACGADGAVGSFKAAVQAIVAHRPVAVAVAGLLVQNRRNLRGHLVGSDLIGMREVDSCELVPAQNRRQLLCRSMGVVGRNVG